MIIRVVSPLVERGGGGGGRGGGTGDGCSRGFGSRLPALKVFLVKLWRRILNEVIMNCCCCCC